MPALLSPGTAGLSCPPAESSAHAWMPHSPCGPECVRTAPEASTLLMAARILGFGAVLASFPLAHVLTPRRRRAALQSGYARTLLHCCGIRVRVIDNRTSGDSADTVRAGESDTESGTTDAARGVLVVAPHIGWTDVMALSAVEPTSFVARADLIDWPVLGAVARKVRVIPIERERLRALPGVIAEIATRLRAGERVGIFPEGTTWCGRAHGHLRPALFQAAVDTGTPVQPIQLRYLDAHGEVSTVPAFVGIDTMADSIRRVLRSRGVVAEITLRPVLAPGTDRHDLARRCERAIADAGIDRTFADLVHLAEHERVAAQVAALEERLLQPSATLSDRG
ncbi:lysophospholipid acyltransferase family protein [Nocardia sp. NPDC005978]|uniref:lysophospholipid acyltransferase family protein n=1 Tax=Nocardia sp. NPDC005978 TaxID=3156725 RepID=UPI0033BDBB44